LKELLHEALPVGALAGDARLDHAAADPRDEDHRRQLWVTHIVALDDLPLRILDCDPAERYAHQSEQRAAAELQHAEKWLSAGICYRWVAHWPVCTNTRA
jgi:hypothetical protein